MEQYTLIKQFIDDSKELADLLVSTSKISEATAVNDNYKKVLLLSCASCYESRIITIISEFVKSKSQDERVIELVRNKALARQYHTYFQWDQTKNINSFLGLFGSEFKTRICEEISHNDELVEQISAFLTIGSERNNMVHQNFLEYKLEKTFDEIVILHEKATRFIEYLRQKFL